MRGTDKRNGLVAIDFTPRIQQGVPTVPAVEPHRGPQHDTA
jgi:hypothetical protein